MVGLGLDNIYIIVFFMGELITVCQIQYVDLM